MCVFVFVFLYDAIIQSRNRRIYSLDENLYASDVSSIPTVLEKGGREGMIWG